MNELQLSIMNRTVGSDNPIQPILDSFAERHGSSVQLQSYDWAPGRAELIKAALYHHGPDVSEVGTTWVSDLAGMNALRPFSESEVEQLGPPNTFLPEAWKTVTVGNAPEVWSIPWLAESLTLHYRKDILRSIGIDEASAFSTPAALIETAQKLRASGYPLPIAVPPRSGHALILHAAASWVWQAGGDFMSADGRSVLFDQPEGLSGFQSYFHLLRIISPEGLQILDKLGTTECFQRGHAPIAIAGHWLHPRTAPAGSVPETNWGVTRLPGLPFVGGSNLVIWKHTRADQSALALIRTLTGIEASSNYGDSTGILSARAAGLYSSARQADRFLRTMYESIQTGRSYPNLPLWGLVEERLVNAMVKIWDALCSDPDMDVDETVSQTLQKVARGLNVTLSQR